MFAFATVLVVFAGLTTADAACASKTTFVCMGGSELHVLEYTPADSCAAGGMTVDSSTMVPNWPGWPGATHMDQGVPLDMCTPYKTSWMMDKHVMLTCSGVPDMQSPMMMIFDEMDTMCNTPTNYYDPAVANDMGMLLMCNCYMDPYPCMTNADCTGAGPNMYCEMNPPAPMAGTKQPGYRRSLRRKLKFMGNPDHDQHMGVCMSM